MAASGIQSIDSLLDGSSSTSIATNDHEAVGATQALLIGHGHHELPKVLAASYGTFGPQTTAALRDFQAANGVVPVSAAIDAQTLQALVSVAAVTPLVSRAYATLVLDVAYTGLLPVATVTMQFEGGGFFGAANLNTDKAGLSFGLIQWAQKPRRLHELLQAFQQADGDRFTAVFGDGDASLTADLLAHTARQGGGVDAAGHTTDARFDLVSEPWRSRFQSAGRDVVFQRAQLASAVTAVTTSADQIRATMPLIQSERGLTFMLDVANQFGDAGAHSIAAAVTQPGMTEAGLLQAAQGESVRRVEHQFGVGSNEAKSTLNRREAIRTTPRLSDSTLSA